MLRRFRKRRDGQQGGDNNYALHSDAPDNGEDDGITMSVPLEDELVRGQTIQQPQHHQQQQPQHLPQPAFKHVLMTGDDKRGDRRQHRDSSVVDVEGSQRGSNQKLTTSISGTVTVGSHNKMQSSIQVRMVTPKREPPIIPPSTTTKINTSPLQERSRQKLDSLSRQHQRYQRQNHFHQYANTTNTLPTSCSVTTDGTMDSSMQPLPDCSRQPVFHRTNNNNYNSIVPPSSLTRRIVTCNDFWDGNNSTAGVSSLESSYYSKHDFHNLPRAFSFAEYSNMSSALETSFDTPGSNGNNNNNGGKHGGMQDATRPMNVRSHEYDYQPTPPQKRIKNDADGGNHAVVTPDPQIRGTNARAASTDDKDSSGTISKAGPIIPPSTTAVAVTPSPPSKSHKPTQKQNQPLHEPATRSARSDPPQQQQGQRASTPNTVDAASLASTAKISNTPHLISRLLMRQPKIKPRTLQQQNNDQGKPKQSESHHEAQKDEKPQQQQQQQSQTSEEGKDPKKEPPKGILKSPPPVARKLVEPPEELPNMQQTQRRRPDPPPDPPAECKHYPSKDSKSQHLRWAREQPSQHRKIQSNMQTESTSHPSKAQQHRNFHNTPPTRKQSGEFQPPSQLNSQKMSRNSQQRAHSELSTPVTFKKVNSTPSNFSSFFTDQTVNTVSTSKFWDDIEGFPDQRKGTRNTFGKDNISRDDIMVRETDEYFNNHLVDVKKDRLVVKGTENMQPTKDTAQQQPAASALPTTKNSKPDAAATGTASNSRVQTPLESIDEDESNAFSLKLPIHGTAGGFDDSDISALQMNDSATVYYQRQLHCGAVSVDSTTYWKMKYDKLKEETIAALGSNVIKEEDDEERHHRQGNDDQDDVQAKGELVELAEIMELHNPKAAHRKEVDENYGSLEETADTTRRTESTNVKESQRNPSPFDSFNQLCDAVMNGTDCSRNQKQYQEVTVHTMKKTAETMLNFVEQIEKGNTGKTIALELVKMKGLGNEIQACTSTCVPEMHDTTKDISVDVDDAFPPVQQPGSEEKTRLVEAPRETAEPNANQDFVMADETLPTSQHNDVSEQVKESFETDDESDGENLKLLGFVPFGQNVEDVSILEQWNKSRAEKCSKSLADDLTAGASRLSHGIVSKEPSDFSYWFDLPAPGTTCIPLLPLLTASLRLSTDAFDASDASPLNRVDDTVRLALADFLSHTSQGLTGDKLDVNVVKQNIGAIVVENESLRFVDSAVTLPEISHAAVLAISRRQFEEATDVYNCLLNSCQNASGPKIGLVGQLIASTLHNLSVLHLWQQEYDLALPCCREALRIKKEVEGNEGDSIDLWANLGLINYAIGSAPSSLAAFRMAAQISSKFYPDEHLMGRLMNNMAVVNFEIGTNMHLVQSQFKQALQMQKGDSTDLSESTDLSVGNILSASISTFNVGVTKAKQNQVDAAISYMSACYSIQQAILDSNDKIVRSTAYYMGSLRRSPSPALKRTGSGHGVKQPISDQNESQHTLHHNRTAYLIQSVTVDNHQEMAEPTKIAHNEGDSIVPQSTKGVSAASQSATPAQGVEISNSYPMLRLGSLRVEATTAQRVHQSLEGCYDSLSSRDREPNLLLLCRRSNIPTKYKTMSQNLIQKGVQAIKKREAQSLLHKNLERFGPRHPEVGKSHHNVGLLCLLTETYNDAVTHLEYAVRIYTNTMGLKHPEVASTLMLKGLAQLALGRFDDSMASMYRVRYSREHILGQQHPELGLILNNMACVQYELKDYKQAEALFQEALDLQREIFSTDPIFLKQVSIVLCNIAFLHAKSGSFPKALIELEGALQIRQDILHEDNDSLSDILQNMAHILAIHQLQHGAVNLDEMTEEYITMLKKSGSKR
ncbi:hypothetical protein ACHAWU_007127 [Discostella pseudostelligera]|uniref:Uncharacterized protein n=1 Tax=Discostella pseudostelligera TaxID=259834 RepID=A0ABD3M0A7_9STRA